MKPITLWKYYRYNKKKYLMVFLSVALSVCLLYELNTLMGLALDVEYLAFVEPQKNFASITPKGELLEDELVDSIRKLDMVEKVLPWVFFHTNFSNVLGENTGTRVMTLTADDMAVIMGKLGLRLVKGRMPQPGSDEILLHRLIAQNKGLRIGDRMGSDIAKNEALPGSHTVVGFVEGKPMVSFLSLETWMKTYGTDKPHRYGILIVPRKDRADELNKYLEYLPVRGKDVRTFPIVSRQMKTAFDRVSLIVTLISVSVVLIVSTNCGFLCYIFFLHRRSEFGILNALGHTRQSLVQRAFSEIFAMNFSGFALGIALSLLAGTALKHLVLLPMGQPYSVWNGASLMKAACVPLLASIISILPIWQLLRRVDPVTVVERVF